VVLLLEHVDVVLEAEQYGGDVLKVVLFKSLELLDSAEKFLQLGDSTAEQVKLAENLVGAKVELFSLGYVLETLLGKFILFDVSLV